MAPIVALVAGCASLWPAVRVQDGAELPVLRSESRVLSIVDGEHVKPDYWLLLPERDPDVYHVELPRKPHTVTFRSDVDEISFPVSFGDRVRFVVLLQGETRCVTEIRAAYDGFEPPERTDPGAGPPAIPFRREGNDKLYVEGRVNGGDPLVFQLDLGSGGSLVARDEAERARLRFDGTIVLTTRDGTRRVPSAASNALELGDLRWNGLAFAVADHLTHREDGLLGNTLFQDRVLEIDHGRSRLVVHDALPELEAGWSKHPVVLDGVVPHVRGSLTLGGERREGWFLLDTGATTTILHSPRLTRWHKLVVELGRILGADGSSSEPSLALGERSFAGFRYTIRKRAADDDLLGLLGNDLLKRCDLVLDNREGFAYLRPNALADAPWRNPEALLARGLLVLALLLGAGGLWLWRRARTRA